jgi:hypothetical protein
MFVRKGTLRKERSSGTRNSGRRNRNHSHEKIVHIRTTALDNGPNPNISHQEMVNFNDDSQGEESVMFSQMKRHEPYVLSSDCDRLSNSQGKTNVHIERLHEVEATPKSSPARSLATTITVS